MSRPRSSTASLRRDAALFARVVLGADLWKVQREILTAAGQHSRVAVKACHASGKSYAIAAAVLWWLVAHRDGIVVTTAPTWLQVEKVIWGEIRSAVVRAAACGKLRFPVPTLTELRLGPQNYAIGVSTDDSARFQDFTRAMFWSCLTKRPVSERRCGRRLKVSAQVARRMCSPLEIRPWRAARSTMRSPATGRRGRR